MKNNKFTLIELIVVIAIVGILISILLPSLKQARGKAETGVCLSNMKGNYALAESFRVSNNGKYPALIGDITWQSDSNLHSFTDNKSGSYGLFQLMLFQQNQTTHTSTTEKFENFICPSTSISSQKNKDQGYVWYTSYGGNRYAFADMGGIHKYANPMKMTPLNGYELSDIIMYSEGDFSHTGFVGQYTMTVKTEQWNGKPTNYFAINWHYRLDHLGPKDSKTLNNTYFDGHAKTLSYWKNTAEMESTQWSTFFPNN